MQNQEMVIELKQLEYFGYVNKIIIIVMCLLNLTQIIAGLTGVAKVLTSAWSILNKQMMIIIVVANFVLKML